MEEENKNLPAEADERQGAEEISDAPAPENIPAAEPVAETETEPEKAPESDAEEVPTEEAPAEKKSAVQPEVTTAFRWDYTSQAEHDAAELKKKKRNGAKTYALVMALAFAVAFAIMFGILFAMYYSRNRDIQITYTGGESTAEVVARKGLPQTVLIQTESSSGSGVIYTADGYIITNYHVVNQENPTITVTFYGETELVPATLVGYSSADDIAVLKVERTGLPAADIGDSDALQVGEPAIAIGNPGGKEYAWSVTEGIVSCVDRTLKSYTSDYILDKKIETIQTTAPVNSGNSGGPLYNRVGEVIGIVSMKPNDSSFVGIGFALPINGVVELVDAIIRDGNADSVDSSLTSGRPLLGIVGVAVEKDKWYKMEENTRVEITEEEAQTAEGAFYTTANGVYVESTNAGTDAAQKLQRGDIVTAINGNEVVSIYMVGYYINDMQAGDTVTLTVVRGGKTITVSLVLGEEKK